MNGYFAKDRKEALSLLLEMIPPGVTVARADSVTLFEIGIMETLRARNANRIIDPFQKDEEGQFPKVEERRKMQREALLSDIFLTSTNAITLDGKIVSVDGTGNRVAAMIFGPKKVIVVAGANKIVNDVEEALQRIKNVAAPLTSIRHALKHRDPELTELPCVKNGKCTDCTHPLRGCRYTVIIEGSRAPEKGRINVILVGEDLGI
jgi:L-lactate utilization protein LutB